MARDIAATLMREAAANAIRTFCQSLGAGTVAVSSDGVERIYYAGLSLDALSVAVALALSAKTDRDVVIEPVWTEDELALSFFDYAACSRARCQFGRNPACPCEQQARHAVHMIKHVLPRSFQFKSPQQEGPKP